MSSPMTSVRERWPVEDRLARPSDDGSVAVVAEAEPDLLARGIVFSLLLSVPLWLVLGVLGWWLVS
jgi:hypothetical protein